MSDWIRGGLSSAPLVTFVSASGGVGKSTLALIGAWLSSSAGIKTTLLEADLQFGDYGFWLGLDDELPDLGLGAKASPIALRENLGLYKAPCFPETAEEVADEVAALVGEARCECELAIADTGQFWSGLTAELVSSSDMVLIVVDGRASSVMGAARAHELLTRIGVPAARCACICNRVRSRMRLHPRELAAGLGLERVYCIADSRQDLEGQILASGPQELVENGAAPVQGVDALLADLLPRLGMVYTGGASSARGRFFR